MQLLLYPMTEHYHIPGRPRGSLELYADDYGYTAELNRLAWDIYGACDPPHGTRDRPNPLAAILRYPDLSGKPLPGTCCSLPGCMARWIEGSPCAGLPPAHIALAECDIVRDEGLAFARALQAAGTPCNVQECALETSAADRCGCLRLATSACRS